MSDIDNVIFFYSGTSYQCVQNPIIDLYFEPLQHTQKLGNGITKRYHEGYKAHISLLWSQPTFMRYDDFEALRNIYNTHDEFSINLSPVSSPGASFTVNWLTKFAIAPVEGVTPFGFSPKIDLEGSEVLSEIPQIQWGTG